MKKNTAGQKWIVFAFDETDNTPKGGDAAQITAKVSKDGAAAGATTDANPTELESGYYAFDIDADETNGDYLVIIPVSSTGNIQVVGVPGGVWTTFPVESTDSGSTQIARVGADGDTLETLSDQMDTAQTDLDTITGTAGVLIATDAQDLSATLDVNTKTITANAITAAAINADAITNAKIADDAIAVENIKDAAITAAKFAANAITSTVVADSFITAAKLNADCITAAKIADDAIAAEHLATGAIVAATFAANAITSTVVADNTITAAKLNADCITNAKIADDAIGAENLATDAISADALSSGAVDEIWAKAMSDLAQGAPSATASVLAAINYLYEAWRNKTETTATRITIYKDDAATELIRSTISDDATTFTKGEMATGV